MSVAIALQYEQGVTPLPVIVAIGKGVMSRKMVEIAVKENITLVTNPALAKALIEEGKVDYYIPDSTINAVAQAMRQTQDKPKH
jgi:type III secretion protein U